MTKKTMSPAYNEAGLNPVVTTKSRVLRLTQMAMLTAISVILLTAIRIPIFPAAPWMVYDMADVPILLAAFLINPAAGMTVLGAVCLLQVIFFGGDGIVGFLMHFMATGSLVLVSSLIYKKWQTNKALITGLVLGAVAMTAMMVPLNYIFTVHFYGTPLDAVNAMMIPVIIPFNLIKAGLNSLICFICFKTAKKLF